MSGFAKATEADPRCDEQLDETTLLSRAAALNIAIPAASRDPVLEGARRLDKAAQLVRDALARMADTPR